MKNTHYYIIKYFVTIFICHNFFAQKFEVKVEKINLKIGETTQIEYVFNGHGDNFNQPSFKSFDQIGSYESSNYKVINGNMSAEKVYSFIIQATKAGTFTIDPAIMVYKGRFVYSKPVTIHVSNQKVQGNYTYNSNQEESKVNPSRLDSKPNLKPSDVVFVDAEVSKSNVYINEPVEVNYVLYVHPRLKFQPEDIKKPDYKGFWAQSEDIDGQWHEVMIGNKIYHAKTFRKTKLIPQKTGNLTVEPLIVEMILQLPTGRVNFWGDEEYNNLRKDIACKKKSIKVNELPAQGKPDNFTGAVGTFDFDVKINKSELKTGEMLNMDLIVSGNGNLNFFDIPKPNFPDVFEVFDPKREDLITESIKGISGKIIDSYTIVPHEKGNFSIAPQKFSYFDVNSKCYKTIKTRPIDLDVLKGTQSYASSQKESKTNEINAFSMIPSANFSKIGNTNFFSTPKSIWIMFIPLLCLPLFILVKRKSEAESDVVVENGKSNDFFKFKTKSTTDYLSTTKKVTQNKDKFYDALTRDLENFFIKKLHLTKDELTKESIKNKLLQKDISIDIINDYLKLNHNTQMAKFSPIGQDSINEDLQIAEKLIKNIDERV